MLTRDKLHMLPPEGERRRTSARRRMEALIATGAFVAILILAAAVGMRLVAPAHSQPGPGPAPLNLTATSPVTVTPSGVGNTARVIACPTCGTGSGDVVGPGSATTTDLASFDGATGKLLQDSGIASANVVTATATLTSGNVVTGAGSKAAQDSGVALSVVARTDTAQSYTKAQRGTPATLSLSGATFTPNYDTAQNFSMTLVHATCPCTVANPSTTPVAGQSGMMIVIQSSTGSDTVTWGNQYKFASATAPTLSTGANAIDALPYYVMSSTQIVVGAGVLNVQ